MKPKGIGLVISVTLVAFVCAAGLLPAVLAGSPIRSPASRVRLTADNPTNPTETVKLVFIHHSCGSNWLRDAGTTAGGLGLALRDSNYFVSDTNYGWGHGSIGSSTDIGHWWSWFCGPNRDIYTADLYVESAQHSTYSRLSGDPGGENEIIVFKSCYPNSHLGGNPADAPTTGDNPLRGMSCGSGHHTVANVKGIYNDILAYFATRQDKLFVVITAPPLVTNSTDVAHAANARVFNDWLVNDWLQGYAHSNVAVFDFYNVLTSNGGDVNTNDLGWESGNHHRWWSSAVQHIHPVGSDFSAYGSSAWDSHPLAAGNQKATGEFVQLLNIYYHRWKDGGQVSTERPLQPGWNLVSLPIVPDDSAMAQVLSSIEADYDLVSSYDACADEWLTYDPDVPGLCTLCEIREDTAFWVRVSQQVTLRASGSPPGSILQGLCPGWNLVAYPAGESRELTQALDSISGYYTMVCGYEAGSADPWRRYSTDAPSWANSLTHLEPGYSYWIYVTQNCTLTIIY